MRESGAVSEETWRPLGLESEDEIADYDALHDGVPPWLWEPLWAWIRDALTMYRSYRDRSGRVPMLNTDLAEQMCQVLRIPLPNLRSRTVNLAVGTNQLNGAIETLAGHPTPLQI